MPPSPRDPAKTAAWNPRIPRRNTHLHSCQRQLLVGRSPLCDSPTTGPAGAALARSLALLWPEARSTVPSARSATAARGSRPAPSPAPQLGHAPCRVAGGSHPGKCRRRAPEPACVPPRLDVRTTSPSRLCGSRRRRLAVTLVPSSTCFWSSAELSTRSKRTRLRLISVPGARRGRRREKGSWSNSYGVMEGLGTISSLPSQYTERGN